MRGDSWFFRSPRPLIMWLAVVVILLVIAFFVLIGGAIVTAFQRSAESGAPVPDMSGGLSAILTGLAALLPAIAAFTQVFHQRHRERMDQQHRGTAPDRPFGPSPPSGPAPAERFEDGGLVNNRAIEE